MVGAVIQFAILLVVLVAIWLLIQWAVGALGIPFAQPVQIIVGLILVLILLYALLQLVGGGGGGLRLGWR